MVSYVEELAYRYYMKKGYLVTQNIWFQPPKEKTGKKVAGWSDIDIFALRPEEALVVQCKSFLGTQESIKIATKIKNWFDYAVHFLENDDVYKYWLKGRTLRKILIVDYTVKITEEKLKSFGIEVIRYDYILDNLFKLLYMKGLRKNKNRIGKEEDNILKIMNVLLKKEWVSFRIRKLKPKHV